MKETLLNEICELIVDCPHSTAYDEGKGYPLVRTPNIGRGRLIYDGMHRVCEDVYNARNARAVPQENDLIFAREATAGNVAIIQKDEKVCLGQRTVLIRPNSKLVDPNFLAYFLLAPKQQYNLLSTANGATVAHVNMPTIRNLKLELPEFSIQKRIATILSRYDSLIENYQKQIKLLEEAAQRLYKEWFVDLRFPGYEKVKVVDGVPEGWERKRAIDFFTISIGKTPPRAEKQWFTDGTDGIPWVSISDMKDVSFVISTSEGLTKEACEKHNIKIVSKGSVLLSFKLTVGRVAIANTDLCTNEAIAHFIKDGENWREYTFLCLRNYNYDSLGNTSGISKAVNSTIVKNMPFLMPTDIVLDKFSSKLVPMFNTIKNLQSQIRNLKESRDRMLVKLMSGEIEV
ncbi:MAG: restriction endonuclease subunit S [Paludibacteraceae bacterium]|nr:restriction endonuclease subunit S [Paludibacteraceae bacterium]